MDSKGKQSTATKSSLSNDKGSVSFPCPKCGKIEIIRTRSERANAVKYTCPSCGFVGPN